MEWMDDFLSKKSEQRAQMNHLNEKIKESSLKIGGGAGMLKLEKIKLQDKINKNNMDLEGSKKAKLELNNAKIPI